MNGYLLGAVFYTMIVIIVCLRILYDTVSTSKTLAYLLITIFLPGIGMIIYFAVGANYRKNKLYSKKIVNDSKLLGEIRKNIILESEKSLDTGEAEVKSHRKLARLLLNDDSPLSGDNDVELLLNGEEKFPQVIAALKAARHHIHIQYYIYENDNIGNQIKDILLQKASEGVQVRFIYDDFGSRSIRSSFVKEMRAGGIEAFPFYKIWFIALSSRTNYRNHRKMIVIDGCTGFVGGINVSDKYINSPVNDNPVYWRDTHLRINGPGVFYLQYLFICDWNFSAGQHLKILPGYFCTTKSKKGKAIVQIAASGPDSATPTIMLTLLEIIGMAQEELLITTPYFIPGETILDAINMATMSGVKVKLLVPEKSDSFIVNSAARSYYSSILDCGAEIYLYGKGFVHAKTMVADGQLAVIGTANMDHRSFELNFEVNCLVYDKAVASRLKDVFINDLKSAKRIDPAKWRKRTLFKQLPERVFRLFSPLL
jgi:cardiolipin synthase